MHCSCFMNSASGVGIKKIKKKSEKNVCVKTQTQSKQSLYVALSFFFFLGKPMHKS